MYPFRLGCQDNFWAPHKTVRNPAGQALEEHRNPQSGFKVNHKPRGELAPEGVTQQLLTVHVWSAEDPAPAPPSQGSQEANVGKWALLPETGEMLADRAGKIDSSGLMQRR